MFELKTVSDFLHSDIHRTVRIQPINPVTVSDRLLFDMFRTGDKEIYSSIMVSDLLLSDKRKHPLTTLFGNEGMFWLCIY